jgi:hypothetical protein
MFYLIPSSHPVSVDLAHNALLLGAVASLKPDEVLELGLGAGYTSGAILQALTWNRKGRLTIVDNWYDWQGWEPPHAQPLREAGVRIVICDEESFVKRCKRRLGIRRRSLSFPPLVGRAPADRAAGWFDVLSRYGKCGFSQPEKDRRRNSEKETLPLSLHRDQPA